MQLIIPNNIKAEALYNYFGEAVREISFVGNHKRNVYGDISLVSFEDGAAKLQLSREGLYDILPEALFHPINRFDNIAANEYKERFAEEVESQRIEESNARQFFSVYDKFIFGLSSIVSKFKQEDFGDNRVLSNIICDSMPAAYKSNRFILRTLEFTPRCSSMRGDIASITLMLRKILAEEGLKLIESVNSDTITDADPKYSCKLAEDEGNQSELYLGNSFEENVTTYIIQYWNEDYCDSAFLDFVEEIRVYERFLNDYYFGIETTMQFNISTETLPVRLSDEMCYNYLDYNTNL